MWVGTGTIKNLHKVYVHVYTYWDESMVKSSKIVRIRISQTVLSTSINNLIKLCWIFPKLNIGRSHVGKYVTHIKSFFMVTWCETYLPQNEFVRQCSIFFSTNLPPTLFVQFIIIKFINHYSFAFLNVYCPYLRTPGNLFWLVT